MVPAAPKTTACFPLRTGMLFITLLRFCYSKDVRAVRQGTGAPCEYRSAGDYLVSWRQTESRTARAHVPDSSSRAPQERTEAWGSSQESAHSRVRRDSSIWFVM